MTRFRTALSFSLLALIAAPSVGHATNARQAILACDKANDKKEGSCDYTVSATGDVTVTVGDKVIGCPQGKECVVMTRVGGKWMPRPDLALPPALTAR